MPDFPFESVFSIQGVLEGPFISIGLALFLLGFYVLLFGLVIYFLLARPTPVNRRHHIGWMTVLFILSVSSALFKVGQIIEEARISFLAAASQDIGPLLDWGSFSNVTKAVVGSFSNILYILANCISDTILVGTIIHLSSSKFRTKTPTALSVLHSMGIHDTHSCSVAIVGALLYNSTRWSILLRADKILTGYYIANAINSFLLTLMIAGRIWWISRDTRSSLGSEVGRKYKRAMAMHRIWAVVLCKPRYVAVTLSWNSIGFGLDTFPTIALMVGIAPTLIFLRTSLGLTASAVPDVRISTLRFGEQPTTTTTTTPCENSEVQTMDLQQGSMEDGGDLEAHEIERSCAGSIRSYSNEMMVER
ncbi:hypothetical protein Moror_7766 [Moniliophthora roreri MCA 2997]|uniref:Uncharacterized protein n=1 Tax=Moniliophthora roreri (strain MCA 2997) TaxID=1381753 RepID=V2X8X2_MONRO|nr:hypothetical protein Moror_7766 [Moniliophthora roreri MCA 2997]